jgi:hypothetical protein
MSVGLRQFHETLRVFVVGKNYRLQNIQLSKSVLNWGSNPQSPRKDLFPRNTEVARNLFTSAAGWVRY